MFLHAGILHLVLNMLMLFFFGPSVEDRMGGRVFVLFYLLCGVGGAASSFILRQLDRKSTRLNSSHGYISYAVLCLKKKNDREYLELHRMDPPHDHDLDLVEPPR